MIRLATGLDAPELARLRWDFRLEEQAGHSRADFLEETKNWFRSVLSSDRWVVVVAESEPGLLCGCMCLQIVEKVPAPGGRHRAWGYVTNAYVASDARGRGVGGQLLDLLVHAARSRKLEFLLVWPSDESVAFYQRAGFRALTEIANDDDPPPLQLIC